MPKLSIAKSNFMYRLKVSIIILSYNTKELLKKCLDSLGGVGKELDFEIIISDNGSTDGTLDLLKRLKMEKFKDLKIVENPENLGFAKGNNRAKRVVQGEYVLFLNSDTEVCPGVLKNTVAYLDKNNDVGALTCKLVLPDGNLDKDVRRSFPTPWVSFTHFTHLDRIFTRSKIFSRYWCEYSDPDQTQEVDVIQGAFFLARKNLLDEVGWFDEDYFLDGEDIDLCWKIKEKGYKIIYYPQVSILHVKGASKGKNHFLENKPKLHDRLRYAMSGVESMEIFYKKRLWAKYPLPVNLAVLIGINVLRAVRYFKLLSQ
ncbi:glycosyltransferase family 2 protein [Candidatus Woesebacteria bacterium]|nr:glycosyltransferase family 2 protein [Candidatus Woesebacteria bacterium]